MEQETINNIIYYLKSSTFSPETTEPEQKYIENNIYKSTIHKDCLYLLQPNELHCLKKVLNKEEANKACLQYHYHPLGGHFAYANTLNRIYQKYYWNNMSKDIFKMIKECTRCQLHGPKFINEKACPVPVPVKPFSQVGIDIKHVTPSYSEYCYIIVAIDYLTKYVEVRALRQQTSAEIAAFIYEEIISRHGCVSYIIKDNGRPMISGLIKLVCLNFKIKHKTISPYHPQSN